MSAAHEQKMCPLLTAAVLKPQSQIIGAPVKEFEAVACKGPQCMFFRGVQDANGRVVGGECSISLIPMAIHQLAQITAQAIQGTPPEPPKH